MKVSLLILLLFYAGRQITQTNVKKDLPEIQILETVFLFQIGHCYDDRSPKLYFLSYKDGDPDEALMERLKNYNPAVRKRSQMFGFKDKDTGELGILLAIRNIQWKSDSVVQVKGSCGTAPLDAYSYEYHVVQKNRKWIVKRRKLTGVS